MDQPIQGLKHQTCSKWASCSTSRVTRFTFVHISREPVVKWIFHYHLWVLQFCNRANMCHNILCMILKVYDHIKVAKNRYILTPRLSHSAGLKTISCATLCVCAFTYTGLSSGITSFGLLLHLLHRQLFLWFFIWGRGGLKYTYNTLNQKKNFFDYP